jgi:hypothetical protein
MTLSGSRQTLTAVLLAASTLMLAAAPAIYGKEPAREPAPLDTLLDRAGKYIVEYENVCRGLVADESYRQMYWDVDRELHVRNLRSDVVFVMLPGSIPWTAFRDVYAVDGRAVRDRAARLEKLLGDGRAPAIEQARAIVREGARFNLGPILRTVNVPPIALLFLHPDNQARFSYKRKGECSSAEMEGVEVAVVERARPTLVRDESGEDVAAKGKVCIDPASGAILRTDIEFDLDGSEGERRAWARILVLYSREAALDALAPLEMKETYQLAAVLEHGATGAVAGEIRIEATARYTGFHRLQVTTQEFFRAAPVPETAPPASTLP